MAFPPLTYLFLPCCCHQVVISVAQHAVGALPVCAPVAALIGGIYSRATQV